MKFAVGYQQPHNREFFSSIVKDYHQKIDEVYFAWPGHASGRLALNNTQSTRQKIQKELLSLRRLGIKLDLLFNANCYGAHGVSSQFEKEIRSTLDSLAVINCLPEIITTTSLMVARTVKKYFPDIDVRASVNMRIGSIQAMGYVADLFDSFYLQRDLQRNLDYVKKVHNWCQVHNKKLCLLVNSGCLKFCPAQTFHDNLIAHNREIIKEEEVADWNPHLCHNLYTRPENYVEILKSTWIRPEDLSRYDGLVDTVKLATRQHSHPRIVIDAYTKGHYNGNLLNLLEPGFPSAFEPYFIDNSAFPADWADHIGECPDNCGACNYCPQVMSKVLKRYPPDLTRISISAK